MSEEWLKADSDAWFYGTGFMLGDKHIPYEDYYYNARETILRLTMQCPI